MTFKQILLASCALVISATAANAQIPSYVPTNGLLGWWPFNGNANDESGNGNDGVVNGATLTEDRNGVANSAYLFAGQNTCQNILVQNSPELNPNQLTINVWIYASDSNMTILEKSDASNASKLAYGLTFKDEFQGWRGLKTTYGVGNCAYTTQNPQFWSNRSAFPSNAWIMITVVIEGNGGINQYCNSELVYSSNGNQNFSPCDDSNSVLRIGGPHTNPDPECFKGKIDDLAIYNRALTPQEIQNLYNGSTETTDTGNGVAPLPQGIPYQAAARDAQGQSLVNAAVNVRFTLHEGAADGAASYAETHALTTNSVGLFNTVFGNGTPQQSAFDSINWAATTKFLQVEIDLGEGYVDMGTTQLLSVPYALRSDEAARVKNAGLPIFSNNAAALAGGLVAGEMYRTAAGVLMVAY